jgi:hypothetical protein
MDVIHQARTENNFHGGRKCQVLGTGRKLAGNSKRSGHEYIRVSLLRRYGRLNLRVQESVRRNITTTVNKQAEAIEQPMNEM